MSAARPLADVVPFPGTKPDPDGAPFEPGEEAPGPGDGRRASSLPVVEQVGRTAFGLAVLMGDAAGQAFRRVGKAVARTSEDTVVGLVSTVIGRIDLEPIVNQVIDRIDFDPIISKVIDSIDMAPIIDDVMSEVRMSSIVMDATGGLTSDLVGDVRERGVEADALLERLVAKVLRRRLAQLPEMGLPEVPVDPSGR